MMCVGCGMLISSTYHSCPYCSVMVPQKSVGIHPTTQKAKGLKALAENGFYATQILALFPVKEALTEEQKKKLEWLFTNYLIFCRPCPPTPQHGFVESRVVKDWEAVEKVRLETLAVCPEAEIMLTQAIEAKWNLIWTPSMLAIGPGHDGATSGKGAVSIPLAGINPLSEKLLMEASIGKGKAPYIEAVVRKDAHEFDIRHSTLTQLRAGPPMEGFSEDVIQKEIKVKEVIKTNGEDLLEWQNKMPEFKAKEGLIIWHPGGAPVDHYSVHCRENGIPIMISREPKVGEVISPTTAITPLDPMALLSGIAAVDRTHLKSRGEYTDLALIALHNSAALRGPHSYWIGVGIGAVLKLGSAALRGEARHAHNCAHGGKQRPDVHDFYAGEPLSRLRSGLSRTTQILYWGFGNPDTAHGYGGPKWGFCGAALVPLFNSVRDLAIEPTEENASKALLALNMAINQAHNGGWWLNKFISVQAYTEVPKGNLSYLLGCPNAIMEMHQNRPTEKELKKFISLTAAWPVTQIEHLKWRHASLEVSPSGIKVNLKASTVPTPKSISIPMTSAQLRSLIKEKASVVIKPGIVQIETPEGVIPVWKEPTIEARQQIGKKN